MTRQHPHPAAGGWNRGESAARYQRRRTFQRATDEAWVTCDEPGCGKRTYHSRKSAKRAANAHGYGETPYECRERGSGLWHLTTSNMDTKEWFRERDERRGLRKERGEETE